MHVDEAEREQEGRWGKGREEEGEEEKHERNIREKIKALLMTLTIL